MRLLLSNDDGYDSPGINILAETLAREHEVTICAPLRQMSATGHAVNIFKPLEIQRISPRIIALDGTPADCVKAAISGLFPDVTFDAVISGINDGPNLGEDVFYSGTVAAAREGALNGIFSIACSRDGWGIGTNYENPSLFIRKLLSSFSQEQLQRNTILNINFPLAGTWNSVELCSLGTRIYQDVARIYKEGNKEFLQIEGESPSFIDQPGSDLNAIHHGNVSITALANVEHDQLVHAALSEIIDILK